MLNEFIKSLWWNWTKLRVYVRTQYFSNFYFNQFYPYLKTITYLFIDTSLTTSHLLVMTLMILTNSPFDKLRMDYIWDCYWLVRTKCGSIKWPPPQQCPLWSLPLHSPHLLATDCNATTHRANIPHPDIPPELLTSKEDMMPPPLSAHWWLFLCFVPNWNSEAWEELLRLSSSSVCSPVSLSLANHLRWLCSCLHQSGYSCLGTVEGCIQAMPPYPQWSEQPPWWAHWLVHTLVIAGEHNGMILLNWHQLCHQFIQNFTARTAWEHCINQWCWNHNWNVSRSLWSQLLNQRGNICIVIGSMLWLLISILKLRFSSAHLKEWLC